MKYRLTPEERAARSERRASIRTTAMAKVDELRQWRQARAEQAAKRAEVRQAALRAQSRGVDRVPERLRGLSVTAEPYTVSKRGTQLAQPADLHPSGNYADRRARGQRGHRRPLRVREMPGAQARRIERRRKEWLA